MKDNLSTALIISDYGELQEKLKENLSRKSLQTTYEKLTQNIVYFFLIVGFEANAKKLNEKDLKEIFDDVQVFKPKSVLIIPYGVDNDLINFAKENAKKLNFKIINLGSEAISDELIEKILHNFFGYGNTNEITIGESKFNLIVEKIKEVQPEVVIRKILIPENKPIKVGRKLKQSKARTLGILIVIVLWIIAVPFLSLFISSVLLKMGFREITSKNLNAANIYFETSKVFGNVANAGFTFSNNGKQITTDILKYDQIGILSVKTINLGQKIFNEASGTENYDLKNQANEFYLDVDNLYTNTSFLSVSVDSKNFLPDINLANVSFYLQSLRKIAKDLPDIMGVNGQKNYLVTVQDSNQLRPTGGYITNLTVYSFNNGRLINENQLQTKDVDSQLRGFVSPPDALKNYAGLSSWNLTNSNWDPNFANSASKAAWFFNKETAQNIDGVIGVTTAPDNINFDNIISLLNDKSVQIFSNNTDQETALHQLDWDGGIALNAIGIVDANVGSNEVNNKIKENAVLSINTTGSKNIYSLEINYTNLSDSLAYKDDVRIVGITTQEKYFQLAPGKGTKISFSWNGNKANSLTLRKQAGVPSLPIEVVINNTTRYNINLVNDKNILISD